MPFMDQTALKVLRVKLLISFKRLKSVRVK
jgi:hypothetical protein